MSSVDRRGSDSQDWSVMLRRSRSAWHDFAARRDYEWDVIEALDQLGTRTGGGGPAYGAACSYWWTLPEGSAEWAAGGFGPHGVWMSGTLLLLMVCEILGLRPPDFATDAELSQAAAVGRESAAVVTNLEPGMPESCLCRRAHGRFVV